MNKLIAFLIFISASPLVLAGGGGYARIFDEIQSVPVLSPVGLAGLVVVVGIGAARVLRNRRNP